MNNTNDNNIVSPIAEIMVWDLYPMERRENLKRYGAELIFFHEGTQCTNYRDLRNKKVIRKDVNKAIEIAKKWKDVVIKVRVQGVYIV